jgi:hypothetical protein
MKNLFITPFLIFNLFFEVYSQLPNQILRMNRRKDDIVAAAGPKNVWATGAQASYNMISGEFADNFQSSGRVLLEILGPQKPNKGVFLMGNLSKVEGSNSEDITAKIRDIQQSTQGLNVALYPHYIWGDPLKKSITLYLSAGWKLNSFQDKNSEEKVYLHQFRLSPASIELTGFVGNEAQLPTTLTVEPAFSFLSKTKSFEVFGDTYSNFFGITTTLILPAGRGRGIIIEHLYSKDNPPTYKVGLMLTTVSLLNK